VFGLGRVGMSRKGFWDIKMGLDSRGDFLLCLLFFVGFLGFKLSGMGGICVLVD
jgi:hypothetical protein